MVAVSNVVVISVLADEVDKRRAVLVDVAVLVRDSAI